MHGILRHTLLEFDEPRIEKKGLRRLKVTARARRRFRGFKGFREKAALKGLYHRRTSINVARLCRRLDYRVSTDPRANLRERSSSGKLIRA